MSRGCRMSFESPCRVVGCMLGAHNGIRGPVFGPAQLAQEPHSHFCPFCNSQCEQVTPAVAGRILHAGRLCGRRGGARPGQSLWIPAVPNASATRGVAFPAVPNHVLMVSASTLEMHSVATQLTLHCFYCPPTYCRCPNEQQIILSLPRPGAQREVPDIDAGA
jgi:hypothetical protein